MKRQDHRSSCLVNNCVEVIGDSWSLLIVRDMVFRGMNTFKEFASSPERISTNILTDRLKALTSQDIIRRTGNGPSTKYLLTEKGLDLLPILFDLIQWSSRYSAGVMQDHVDLHRILNDRDNMLNDMRERLIEEHGIELAV